MNRIPRPELLGLSAILLFSAAFRLALLNRPFDRDPEGCGAFYGLVARNYFRHSMSESHGLPIISMGTDCELKFYANHPPSTPLLIAVVHWLTGYRGGYDDLPGDWQTRLPTSIFTVGCVALIFALMRRRTTERAALLAAALFAAIPMTLYYGGQPDVINTQLVFFALLTIAAYQRFADAPGWGAFGWLSAAFLGAGLMDWPAFHLVPILGVHYLCTHPPRQWKWIIGFGVVSVLIFAALYAHLAMGKESWGWMFSQLERRAGGQTDSATPFTLAEWVKHALWGISVARHTVIVVSLALCGAAMAASRRFAGPADRFTGLLLAWGVLHVLVGRQGVYQHEWWWWPMTPGLVIAAAMAIDQIASMTRLRPAPVNASIAILLLLFTGWNVRAIVSELNSPKRIDKGGIEYSLAEVGEVIRQNAPPDRAVLVADSDQSLGFWYYADRAVKRFVWDPPALQRRLEDGHVDLSFDTPARFPQPAAVMIVPKSYLGELPALLEYLDARYGKRDTGKFLVYDLGSHGL